MTISYNDNPDKVRFHKFHRWLNPLASERATLFSHLRPDEITESLWPYLDQSYEPDSKKEFLEFADATISFLTALPKMTGQEIASRLEDLGRIFRDGDADGIPLEGSAHPGGFRIWHVSNRSVSLRATYREGGNGTMLEVDFGPDDPTGGLSKFLLEIVLFIFLFSLVAPDLSYSPVHSLNLTIIFRFFIVFGFCLFLASYGIVITLAVGSRWAHRNDFAYMMSFLARFIDVRETGETK